MQAILLQDWITIKTKDTVSGVTQSAHEYVDLGQHEDLVFYLDVKDISANTTLLYETSPTRQDSLFLAMIPEFAPSVGLRVDRVMFSTAAVPPARYVRWRMHTSSNCSLTFRIWLAAYAFA